MAIMKSIRAAFLIAGVFLGLAACGGGDDAHTPTPHAFLAGTAFGCEDPNTLLQRDGKIIVVGSERVGSSDDFAIVRYLPEGEVDTTFGTQGKTTTDFFGQRDRAFAVAIQPDNRIVVVGDAFVNGNSDFAVARYDANGVLDTSFGGAGTGKVATDIAEHVDIGKNVVIESNGTILVTGPITMGTSPELAHTGLARYSNAGVLDSSLGTHGTLSIPNMQLADDLALQPDGKILVAGNVAVTGNTLFGVMRLGTNGFPDLDYGFAGLATAGHTALTDFSRDVTLDAQGRVLVSGSTREARERRLQFEREFVGGCAGRLMIM
jgi:uncharacterized delta-60 repeat protein